MPSLVPHLTSCRVEQAPEFISRERAKHAALTTECRIRQISLCILEV
jgi:hypothetical protein